MKKAVITAVALTLVLCLAVGGTLAYLVATSDPVTNTFTVGDIKIDLAETKEGPFKVVPGATDAKDPSVTVESGSEKCYVYVKITNDLVIGNDTVATYNIGSEWVLVGTSGNAKLYRYGEVVDAATADVKKPVFTTVTYDGEKITKANIETLKNKTIVLQAYAHQSENITGVSVADTAANTWAGTVAVAP